MEQKKILSLSIMATLLISIIFSAVMSHYGVKIDTSPIVLGQYGGGSSKPSPTLISSVTAAQAYEMLSGFGPNSVAEILNYVQNDKVIDILVLYPGAQEIMEILQQMDKNKAGSLLLDMEIDGLRPLTVELMSLMAPRHSGILEYMLNTNIPLSALLIEDTIKVLTEGLNETNRYKAVRDLASALNLVSQDNLAELFFQLAGFPDSPNTVGYLVESMDADVVLYIFGKWMAIQEYETLINVLEYIATPTLGVIYRGMGGENRMEIYPYLTESILSRLPDIGFFQISLLSVFPSQVELGDPVKISFTLENIGEQTDDYSIPILVNGETEETYSGIMEEGSSEFFELNVTRGEGLFNVNVESESVSFRVRAPPPIVRPAEFEIENIQVIPEEVVQGEEMQVFMIVTNVGEEDGFETFELLIDSRISDFLSTQLLPGETKTLVFTLMAEFSIGDHVVQIRELTRNFFVTNPPTNTPWITIIVSILVIFAAIAYYLYENDYFKGIFGQGRRYAN